MTVRLLVSVGPEAVVICISVVCWVLVSVRVDAGWVDTSCSVDVMVVPAIVSLCRNEELALRLKMSYGAGSSFNETHLGQ